MKHDKPIWYIQCIVKYDNETYEQCWLPSKFAKQNKVVIILERKGTVVEVFDSLKIEEEYLETLGKEYRYHCKVTNI